MQTYFSTSMLPGLQFLHSYTDHCRHAFIALYAHPSSEDYLVVFVRPLTKLGTTLKDGDIRVEPRKSYEQILLDKPNQLGTPDILKPFLK